MPASSRRPNLTMNFTIKTQIRAVYTAVLVLGALLSVLIFVLGEEVVTASRTLVRDDLPMLSDIAALKVEAQRKETVLYEYMVTRDRAGFEREYRINHQRLERLLKAASGFSGNEHQARVREQYRRIDELARELEQMPIATPIDKRLAADRLAAVSVAVRQLNVELDVLMDAIQVRMRDSVGCVETYVPWMSRIVVLFSAAIFVIAVFIGYAINTYLRTHAERRRAEEQLVHQAYHDALTGLPNRRMYQEFADAMLGSAKAAGNRAALLLLGLDRFKNVINSYGHETGDRVLQAVAIRLKEIMDEHQGPGGNAMLYRLEGDLYAIFIPAFASSQLPVLAVERITQGLGPPLYVDGREFYVSFSMGVAVYPLDGSDAVALLKNADTAMHRVKESGGHGFQLYKPEMNAMAASFLTLENYLRHALEREELVLYYQPQVDVRTGRTTGVEALLRWRHPERGLLTPEEFIQLAEETGLIVPISEWALRAACAQSRRWRAAGLLHTAVAVNVSASQFHQQKLPTLVAAVLADSGLEPHMLELEITESIAMQDIEHTVAMLHELKAMQVRLAIDDFGTGFSSLNYLKRFPVDKLKIDRSFVRNLMTDEADAAITRAIVTLGHALGRKVAVEGIETAEQLARLHQYGCDEVQGNFIAAACPPEQMTEWLKHDRRQVAR